MQASSLQFTPVCSAWSVLLYSARLNYHHYINREKTLLFLMGAGVALMTTNTFRFALICMNLNECCLLEI